MTPNLGSGTIVKMYTIDQYFLHEITNT